MQNKLNSLSDARNFDNPESGSSSGATHVPSQPLNILSPRTVPRRDSGLPRDTLIFAGTTGSVFERPLVQERRSSTFFNNSKKLASPSQELSLDAAGTTRKQECEMKRDPLNTSFPLPHIQSGCGTLNHTGGTYSHGDMIDYPTYPASELHLGKFPDSVEFQSCKVNFETQVCTKTADSHITMHWIKEVEMAKSIDERVTSRSIVGRTNSPDFDVLDAMIASALKTLLDKHIHFRRRVSVEEQRAQTCDRFLRGRQVAYMIFVRFHATRAYEAVQGLPDLFSFRLQNDDVQDFDVRWDQPLLSASEVPSDVIL